MTHPPENPTTPEPVQAEPVLWMYESKRECRTFVQPHRANMNPRYWTETPLYTRPTPDLAGWIEGLVEAVGSLSRH